MAEAKANSRIFLLSSLALGVLAMVAAFVYLQSTAGKNTGPTANVIVAKRDIRENMVLDPDKDLTSVEVPRIPALADMIGRSLDFNFLSAYKGQRVNRPIQAGQLLMKSDLSADAVMELKGEERAMSVSVKGGNGLGGLLVPGDYVQIMVTRPLPPPSQQFETILVAPMPFRVLAVNDRLTRSRTRITAAEAYQAAGENMANPTVTLAVNESQAMMIQKLTGAGKHPITLVLCPPPDKITLPTSVPSVN